MTLMLRFARASGEPSQRRKTGPQKPQSATGPSDYKRLLLAVVAGATIRLEDRNRLDFDEQIRPAQNGLDARGCRQRIQFLLLEELGANLVESLVVPLDVAQIARGAHNVLPRRPFCLQQSGDVLVGPPALGTEVARVDRVAVFIHAGRARDEQDCDTLDVQPQRAGEGRGLRIVVGFVQCAGRTNGLFGDGLERLLRRYVGF